jgi:hypothetical protein
VGDLLSKEYDDGIKDRAIIWKPLGLVTNLVNWQISFCSAMTAGQPPVSGDELAMDREPRKSQQWIPRFSRAQFYNENI